MCVRHQSEWVDKNRCQVARALLRVDVAPDSCSPYPPKFNTDYD